MIRKLQLNEPSADAKIHSQQLVATIKQEISSKGPISFARYMALALYTPQLGYYMSGLQKFGRSGDFTTAPEISKLYSMSVAVQCQQILTICPGAILEFGAGTGRMAAQILTYLQSLNCVPEHYYIFEISPYLQQQQRAMFNATVPHLLHKVVWLDSLENFTMKGIVIANEVIDAFPVHRFKVASDKSVAELYIDIADEELVSHYGHPSSTLSHYLQSLAIDFAPHYESECNLEIAPWLQHIDRILVSGVVLLMDYGFPRHEYYHPERSRGTFMCHYHHQGHDDPLILVGLQDMTAHVDFTAIAEAASAFNVVGYTNQASFLLSCGIVNLLEQQPKDDYLTLTNEIKLLTSPNDMGELFKVMALTKNFDLPLLGFVLRNTPERL